MKILSDNIIFSPKNVDLNYSPINNIIRNKTYIMGAFNPGMCRLPNGNILLIVRIAESLKEPIHKNNFSIIRKDTNKGYVIDKYPAGNLNTGDPRKYSFAKYQPIPVYGLTSFSWLLPIELTPDGQKIIRIHYDKIIEPQESYQEYGLEDPRITYIDGKYYMTTCSVSSERHCTTLYSSEDGLDYKLVGIILDHQNKDMVLFPQMIEGKYYALTRPLGNIYFITPKTSDYNPGPAINLAVSPDLLHWKPVDEPFIRAKKDSLISMKLGGGAPPIASKKGWLILFHGVEKKEEVGIYRTYLAILDKMNPSIVKYLDENNPVLQSQESLTRNLKKGFYIKNVVFTTGILAHEDNYIIASGELDFCCRITTITQDSILAEI